MKQNGRRWCWGTISNRWWCFYTRKLAIQGEGVLLWALKIFFFCFYVYTCLPACTYMHHLHAVPTEVRRGCQMPQDCRYRQLCTAMWLLRVKPESSGKAAVLVPTDPGLQQFLLFVLKTTEYSSGWPGIALNSGSSDFSLPTSQKQRLQKQTTTSRLQSAGAEPAC